MRLLSAFVCLVLYEGRRKRVRNDVPPRVYSSASLPSLSKNCLSPHPTHFIHLALLSLVISFSCPSYPPSLPSSLHPSFPPTLSSSLPLSPFLPLFVRHTTLLRHTLTLPPFPPSLLPPTLLPSTPLPLSLSLSGVSPSSPRPPNALLLPRVSVSLTPSFTPINLRFPSDNTSTKASTTRSPTSPPSTSCEALHPAHRQSRFV